jgi:hypothetical protein
MQHRIDFLSRRTRLPFQATEEESRASVISLSYQLRPELGFQRPKKRRLTVIILDFWQASQSTSPNICILQSPPPGPAKMSVLSGAKGETAQQARSLVCFSRTIFLHRFATPHPIPRATGCRSSCWQEMELDERISWSLC